MGGNAGLPDARRPGPARPLEECIAIFRVGGLQGAAGGVRPAARGGGVGSPRPLHARRSHPGEKRRGSENN